ncbi:alpha-ketoglutarate-dependent dioxygenase alkB isoform X2 [Prosopis cineraria]|uniref:alpha-ketoglutarate-dependent dioxygenase alkB isoform X2 n=1 Tax=Prosopis cineraria TaxID=364024 RepID=UPI00240FF19F|nr:alpha-ketoglutarate-dependent dioxygenase alkB isoform X2 [Prosopis cineraria]
MYGSEKLTDDSERTAFRRAEKKYKLYYDNASKKKKQPKPVDLSEVLDFRTILECHKLDGELPSGVILLEENFMCPVFSLENRPGFYFLPGPLTVEEQCTLIKESLIDFPQPPNRTNHNAIYGPIHDLFLAAKEGKVLVEDNSPISSSKAKPHNINGVGKEWKFYSENAESLRSCKSVSASALLRKLRWSTLGLQFDWSKRNYDVSLPHNKIPDALSELAKQLAKPALPVGVEFQPEAAIVNYFALGDTLGGHLDDMEADWSKPIVSLSLGCKAIFLLGGKSRDDPPLSMFLRSGDVVLMVGEARECFHGVPRIFTDKENAEIDHLEAQLLQEDDLNAHVTGELTLQKQMFSACCYLQFCTFNILCMT